MEFQEQTRTPRQFTYHVFLSHHAADQPAVEAIARQLQAADLAPFLDRWHLVPGDPWMEAIEEALASSETVAVFVGPSGIGPWQNEEMRVALYDSALRGKRVIPVLLPGADPQRVSPFLTRRTWVDFRAGFEDAGALQRLIAGIQGLPSETGGHLSPLDLAPPTHYFTPFQAPPLPPYFVPRPEAAEAIRAALLDARSDTPGVLAISAIHGLGGIGKTTLIAALAHDPAIRQRYPDGILWATLGQQPELFPRLLEWIQQLGDYNFKPTTLEGASSHLRTLLIDKACLLVVDDAWQREHVDHFLVGGARSQVVITTRDATLARKLRAHLHDLNVMTEAQALALFEGRLGTLSAANGRDQAAALARELGYLPLALELAAAQIESGRSWGELLAHFRSAFADLAVLDLEEATRRDESLRISFALSLDSLAEEDRSAFIWFGVLPEDAVIGPAMAATLWDETEVQARERLRRLRHKALLKETGEDRYTVHDLLHDETKLHLAQQAPLSDAHAEFLARYATHCQTAPPAEEDCAERGVVDLQPAQPSTLVTTRPHVSVLWHTLPDDGYIRTRLTWHMEQAGQIDAIHGLLREETTAGGNGWYSSLDATGMTITYIDDLSLAWRYSELTNSVGLQCRYALSLTSLNSIVSNLPSELVSQLLISKIWSPVQALAYVRQLPEGRSRCDAVAAVASFLPRELRQQMLQVVYNTSEDWDRTRALVSLVPLLDEHMRHQVLEDAFKIAHEIEKSEDRCSALASLIPYLDGPRFQAAQLKALETAFAVKDEEARCGAIESVVPFLDKAQCHQAMKVVKATRPSMLREQAISALTMRLHPERIGFGSLVGRPKVDNALDNQGSVVLEALPDHNRYQQNLERLQAIQDDSIRCSMLMKLAPQLDKQQLEQALEAAWAIRDAWHRSKALACLAAHLSEPKRPETLKAAVRVATTVGDDHLRFGIILKLASFLTASQRNHLFNKAGKTWDEWYGAEALAALAFSLTASQRNHFFEKAIETSNDWYRAEALAALASYLTEVQRYRALNAALAIQSVELRSNALSALAIHLSEHQRRQVLKLVLTAKSEAYRSSILVALASVLSEDQCQQVLEAVPMIRNLGQRSDVMLALVPHLNESQRWYVLKTIVSSEVPKLPNRPPSPSQFDEKYRSSILAALVPYLSESQHGFVLKAAQSISYEEYRADVITALVPHLNDQQRQEALNAALANWYFEEPHTRLLDALIASLNDQQRQQALKTVLVMERNEELQARVIVYLVPHLNNRQRLELLDRAVTMQSKYYRAVAFAALAQCLSEHQRQQLLELGLDEDFELHRAYVLSSLMPYLNEHQIDHALLVATTNDVWEYRCDVFCALASRLRANQREYVLDILFADYSGKRFHYLPDGLFSRVLVALVPNLDQDELLCLFRRIRRMKLEVLPMDLISELAPTFTEGQLPQVLMAVADFQDEYDRIEAITALIPYLHQNELLRTLDMILAIHDEEYRGDALTVLVPRLARVSSETLVSLWPDALHRIARRTRGDLLSDLHDLMPIIKTIATPDDMAEIAQAIIDVGRWWP